MGQVRWVMMLSARAGNRHFLRIAVVTWVHYRGLGENGTATEFVSLAHLDWNWMELRRENRCQWVVSDHVLWVTVQPGLMRGLEHNIRQAEFVLAPWESGVLIAVQQEDHLV